MVRFAEKSLSLHPTRCGSCAAGRIVENLGHFCIGFDISRHMLLEAAGGTCCPPQSILRSRQTASVTLRDTQSRLAERTQRAILSILRGNNSGVRFDDLPHFSRF